ncbi:hypothetical protein [Rothia aeria]|nr:hypothetical protein [Rothia sp. RSM482]
MKFFDAALASRLPYLMQPKKSLYVNKALKIPLYSHKGSFLHPAAGV